MQSDAKTVSEYLKSLPEERQVAIQAVRQVILDNLPEGYEEVMNWGMITYQVPLEQYPDTYNKKPLMYAALASQKNHMSVYLTGIYMEDSAREEFESSYKATGKRYDVGKSCVRFRKLDDLPLELIGESIARFPMQEYVEQVRSIFSDRTSRKKT
ncbi:iron chaperone [Chloroflexota bacterium]